LWSLTATVVVLALVLGGGTRQGLWSDAAVQLASLVLLAFLLPVVLRNGFKGRDRWTVSLVGAALVLPLIQLVPLPPTLWMLLPGRAAIAEAYRQAEMAAPWLPISLDPAATWRSFLSLLPAIAVFFATRSLGPRARRGLTLLLIAIGLLSVLLGLAQLMQGPASPLRFYPVTNPDNSVGFFANRNHYAALLYGLIPFVSAWIVGLLFDRRPDRIFGLVVCVLIFAAFVLGLGMALSRAGILLAIAAAAASLLLAARREPRAAKHGYAILGGAILLGVVLIVQYALLDLLGRFDDNALADYRLVIAATTIDAARAFQPIGSGFGTFVQAYQMFEPRAALRSAYVNHAHSDWLEIWLEGGWFALTVLAGFLIWFIAASRRAWRAPLDKGHALDSALAQAASIVIILLLLHSAADYPLRTTALMTLFAFCCALLMPPVPQSSIGMSAAASQPSGGSLGWPGIRSAPLWRPRRRTNVWQVRRSR
jgi:O-antigen ligase